MGVDRGDRAPPPADYDTAVAALLANLREPGRMDAARKMGRAQPARPVTAGDDAG